MKESNPHLEPKYYLKVYIKDVIESYKSDYYNSNQIYFYLQHLDNESSYRRLLYGIFSM